jgi:hypothetical protein
MVLKGENRSTWRKTSPSTTSSTKNLTLTELGPNSGVPAKRPATNRLSR